MDDDEVLTGDVLEADARVAVRRGNGLVAAAQVANTYAAAGVFADYQTRKSDNTLRGQAAALDRFADYLAEIHIETGDLQHDPEAWRGVSWGLVGGFRNWLVAEGDAIATVNNRLTHVKTYAKLAFKAGVLTAEDHALIRTVTGYGTTEGKRIDERRATTRRGAKKAAHVRITTKQARQLKQQPDSPQGRRDAVLMALLLDHGLRVGEVARLQVTDVDLVAGELRFYRPKVDKVQTHRLSADTRHALEAYFEAGDAPPAGPLLRASRRNGTLDHAGMSETALSERVRALGKAVRPALEGLSAHDCRHYWATYWADKVSIFRLGEAGGWSSLEMPRRYVEESAIANEGMA